MQEMRDDIFEKSAAQGWVLEPDCLQLLAAAGLDVPRHRLAASAAEAVAFAEATGYPVVAKVVSPLVVHKTEVRGVVTGLGDAGALTRTFERLAAVEGSVGVLVEETVTGVELIVGAKHDEQFGPVVLLGIGGTGVELYKDTVIGMAPLAAADVPAMLDGLRGRRLLDGFRGAEPVNREALAALLLGFSGFVLGLGDRFESIDCNPVLCNGHRAVVADARIMLAATTGTKQK